MKKKRTINLHYAFKYIDNPERVKRKNTESKIRALGRLQGSSKEDLQDMSMYNH